MPGRAHVYTRKKLLKKTVTTKVPSYKWVVEDLCSRCESISKGAYVPRGVNVPPLPSASAKVGDSRRQASQSLN
jgi:hypothetical protein